LLSAFLPVSCPQAASRAHRAGRNSILQYRLHAAKLPKRENFELGLPKTTDLNHVRLSTVQNPYEFVNHWRFFTDPK
jgi:hypothetical protein